MTKHLNHSLVSSTIDIWVKSTEELKINDWYMTGHYHRNTGEGGDGVWVDMGIKKLRGIVCGRKWAYSCAVYTDL